MTTRLRRFVLEAPPLTATGNGHDSGSTDVNNINGAQIPQKRFRLTLQVGWAYSSIFLALLGL